MVAAQQVGAAAGSRQGEQGGAGRRPWRMDPHATRSPAHLWLCDHSKAAQHMVAHCARHGEGAHHAPALHAPARRMHARLLLGVIRLVVFGQR